MYEDNILYWMWLKSMPGIGSILMMNLYNSFGSIEKVYFNKDVNRYACVDKISPAVATMLAENKDLTKVKELLDYMVEMRIKYITVEDEDYPAILKEIYDYPPVLFYKGRNILKENTPRIAMVGARNPTNYGISVARQFAKIFSDNGIDVVSGLALGIDAASHVGAMEGAGDTIAVLGCGVDKIYPLRNRDIYERIVDEKGMVISEYLPMTPAKPEHFPARNRIISGLCYGTLVVEASYRSGSLITARYANEQGRSVFAVPGNITSKLSVGCNRLIRDGARPILNVREVYEDLYYVLKDIPKVRTQDVMEMGDPLTIEDIPRKTNQSKSQSFEKSTKAISNEEKAKKFVESLTVTDEEMVILKEILKGNNTVDLICKSTNWQINNINSFLTMLEIRGIVIVTGTKIEIDVR